METENVRNYFPLTDEEIDNIIRQHIDMNYFTGSEKSREMCSDHMVKDIRNIITEYLIPELTHIVTREDAEGAVYIITLMMLSMFDVPTIPPMTRKEIDDLIHNNRGIQTAISEEGDIDQAAPAAPEPIDMEGQRFKAPRYPRPNDEVTVSTMESMALRLQGALGNNGMPIEFTEDQHRLVNAVRMALASCDEDGYTDHIIPTEGIAKFYVGGDSDTSISPTVKSKVDDLMEYFWRLQGYDPETQTYFKIIHFDYIKNAVINGQLTTGYKIYHVIGIPVSINILYSQWALPPGFANSPENFRIWRTVINNNGKVDLEELYKSLHIARNNKSRRHDVKDRLTKMIRHYKLQDSVKLFWTLKGKREEEVIKIE